MTGPPPPFDFAVANLAPTSGSNLTPPPVSQQASGISGMVVVVVVTHGHEHTAVSEQEVCCWLASVHTTENRFSTVNVSGQMRPGQE
jgi:hypothetical protein